MNLPTNQHERTSLGVRMAELERERSEAQDHVRLLVALQNAFASIAVTRSTDEVIAQVLRAARDPLGFSRGIFFSVDRESGVTPRWELDTADVVEAIREPLHVRGDSALFGALRGKLAQSIGHAGELSAPLVDTRGWYVLTTLTHAGDPLGLLYLDGHRTRAPRNWETGLVQALATIASVSIDNSFLLARTEELATRDPLTGLYNRRAFTTKLDEAIASARLVNGSLTYVIIDLDDFKKINDCFGHLHGDSVLRDLAQALTRTSRTGDIIGRYAGDEFVAILKNSAGDTSRALVARLSSELFARGLRCSLGASVFPKDAYNGPGLLYAADRALYATKARGKNGFSFA